MKRLLIIDGNHMVHRAYHAYPQHFTSPDGRLVGMVYGWFTMVIKVIEVMKPTHVAICFDRPKPTFRKEMYSAYQAKRPEMLSEMSDQIKYLQEAITEIGLPFYAIDGYEADDLIGTLALQAEENCGLRDSNGILNQVQDDVLETIILSGDRDLLQLVDEYTKELMPQIGMTKFSLMDEAGVKEKYGILPSQITDYKALVGDASDGYPGVSGIGPKTASGLLQKYETFEALYDHLAEIPERVANKLATDAEQGVLSKKLAIIIRDAPVHLVWEDIDLAKLSREKVAEVFENLGIHSLQRRLNFLESTTTMKKEKPKKVEPNDAQLSMFE